MGLFYSYYYFCFLLRTCALVERGVLVFSSVRMQQSTKCVVWLVLLREDLSSLKLNLATNYYFCGDAVQRVLVLEITHNYVTRNTIHNTVVEHDSQFTWFPLHSADLSENQVNRGKCPLRYSVTLYYSGAAQSGKAEYIYIILSYNDILL